MKDRILAFLCLSLMLLNLSGSLAAGADKRKIANAARNELVSMLPASDGVAVIDVKRFFTVALPKLMASNQPMLDKVIGEIDEMTAKTGIDVRQFDYIAAGITAKKVMAKEYDLEPVVVARGQVNSSALLEAARSNAKGKFREEKAGTRTIYVFSATDLTGKDVNASGSTEKDLGDKLLGKLSKEIAVSEIDANTVVFGHIELVRQALAARSKVSGELVSLLNKRSASVVNFAAKLPAGMSAFLPLDNDELGKNIESIRFVYGGMDMAGDSMSLAVTARTQQSAQASSLLETLEGLQLLGKAFIGGVKGPERQVYARLIDNAKFSAKGNEVAFELQVPQSDIEILVGMLK